MGGQTLRHWTAPARKRAFLDRLALGLPLVIMLAAGSVRFAGPVAAVGMIVVGLTVTLFVGWREAARHDRDWLIHSLDRRRADMDDSAALLFADQDMIGPLQRLQQARLFARLDDYSPNILIPNWHGRAILILWSVAVAVTAAVLLWPRTGEGPPDLVPSSEGLAMPPGQARLVAQNLRIIPPAYTGLPVRDSASLDARIPQGSRIEWTLRFDPQATAPKVATLAGPSPSLRRSGGDWFASHIANAAFLYRIEPAPGRKLVPPLHRIDIIPDRAPHVRALSPKGGVTMVAPGQRSWSPVFVATDDYGIATIARLRVTLAIGEGENVTFSDREIAVSGSGAARDKRFAPRLDFGALGFAAGGDMVVQLIVRDNRNPAPQETRGPSIILRWPAPKQPESSGLQGMVNTTLPAYFRSQRQIIIDAEGVLKQKSRIAADRYVARSAAIGSDQQILRGRYSQFLGGEEEGEPKAPTADGADHSEGDGHDHGGPPRQPASGFGAPEDVLAAFGHPHDNSPASSLDPETRAILKNAVDEMWQSEVQLKQGRPDLALPFAYRALRFIKQVQQATRIFLARVGPELPPIDASRRMTGKREGLASRALPIAPVAGQDGPAAAAWRALGEGPDATTGPLALDALARWINANAARLPDALALTGALDAVRRDPACASCRAKLRAGLWSAMERPPAHLARRRPADSAGQRYLQSISGAR
ncbi:DUF4175 domain-containing protein [Sphingobium sp.]|uniref:DUF4175 domain-containing protein n=1 Tax=Sphingobium sp. TaxID=1912891 RepID=UPI003BB7AF71